MTPKERKILIDLNKRFASLDKSDRYTFLKLIQMLDGRNFQFGLTTGTQIGTSALEKIGFWGVTPVVQQGSPSSPSGGAVIDAEARAIIDLLRTVLINVGITA